MDAVSQLILFTCLQQAVYELQIKSETFLNDPDTSLSVQYECWLEIITDQLTESRLAKHLSNSDILSEQYKTLCPEHVSHDSFWKRYLFKKALLEDNIAYQEELELKRKQLEECENDEENNIIAKVEEVNAKVNVVTTTGLTAGLTATTPTVDAIPEHFKWDDDNADISNIDLTEEEQVKLLEQYENEFKCKRQKGSKKQQKKNKSVAPVKSVVEEPAQSSDDVSFKSNSAETKSSSSSLDGEWESIE